VTPKQLESLLNEILKNDQKLPYVFFLAEKLLETDLQQHLVNSNVSVELRLEWSISLKQYSEFGQ